MLTKLLRLALINFIIFLILPIAVFAREPYAAQDSQPIELLIPGRIEKVGTFFEIENSEYLNIALKSAEEIKVILESVPQMISLNIEIILNKPAPTTLTIEGLEPNKSYFKYQDSYKNEAVFISDENGRYSWSQDLTRAHHIWIQEIKGTIFIPRHPTFPDYPGQCKPPYGTWNPETLTCTLNQDLTESVEITQNNLTLDCNSHKITSLGGYGIYLADKKGVTIKNCTINNFSIGIFLWGSNNNSVSNNSLNYNSWSGIYLFNSNNNTLNNNSVANSNYGFIFLNNSNNNTLNNNLVENNSAGIFFYGANNNTLNKNSVNCNNFAGIYLLVGNSNILRENNINNNSIGIFLIGIFSQYNQIYHNNFIDNQTQFQGYVGPDNRLDNGYPEGGNYWSDYTGKDLKSGPNQDQLGTDGIGDTRYAFTGGEDRYPFIKENGWEKPQKWSFAIISDLHVGDPWYLDYGSLGWNDGISGQEPTGPTSRLRKSVGLINSNKNRYNIAFVVALGDLSSGAELSELNKAKEILNELEVPWVPLIGNHDIWPYTVWIPTAAPEVGPDDSGTDKFFNDIFNSQYEKLSTIFSNWKKANIPTWNPETSPPHNSYFQNFAFDFNNYHFIGLDFNYREDVPGPIPGVWPAGELHNFPGGTWNWFTNHLQEYINGHLENKENIILLGHHPFRKWRDIPLPEMGVIQMGFSDEEQEIMYNFLKDYKDKIWGEFAGHSHNNNKDNFWRDEIMKIVETGANVEDSLVRIVQVYPDGRIDYSKMLGNGITTTGHSPIDLIITDPDGLIIDKQSNEIPGASYYEEDLDGDGSFDDLIEIPERKLGNYQIKVVPELTATATETYTLEVSTLEDSFGYTSFILAKDIPISEIPSEPYIFESKEREATQLTYKGDLSGQYSDKINLSATLTDRDGNLLSNKTVIFEIGEQSISALTDNNGVATTLLTLNQIPGKYYFIETNFSSDQNYLPFFDSKPFEIVKENVVITVLNKEGFYDEDTKLEAIVKDDDGENLLQGPYELEFKVGEKIIGKAVVDKTGKVTIDWKIDLIPKELLETYPIIVTFSGNEYYLSAEGKGIFTLKSTKWLKQDAIKELKSAKTGNKLIDKKIDLIIRLINQSLNEKLWIDASRLVFFEDLKCNKLEEMLKSEELDFSKLKTKCPGLGIIVFYYEKTAIELMMLKPKNSAFEQVIKKLIKADFLLANVSLYDAKNTLIKNPKLQKIVEYQIKKAEEEIKKGQKELEKNKLDKATTRIAKAWFHSQLAIKFANLEIKP